MVKRAVLTLTVTLAIFALCVSLRAMVQDIVYGTPQTQMTKTKANVAYITIMTVPSARIDVGIVDEDGLIRNFGYPALGVAALDTEAKVLTLITSLNTANFSGARAGFNTGSLRYRIADFLCRDFTARMPSGSCSVQ